MHRPAALVVAVAAFVMAGCIEGATDPAPPTAETPAAAVVVERDDEGRPLKLAYESCTEYGAITTQRASDYEAKAPNGFKVLRTDPAGAATFVMVLGWKCRTPDNGTVSEMLALLPVVPPAQWAAPKAKFQMVLLVGWTSNPDVAAAYLAWQITGMREAPVAVGETILGETRRAVIQAGDVKVEATFAGDTRALGAGFARLFHAESGKVHAWEVAWSDASEALDDAPATISNLPGTPNPSRADVGRGFYRAGESYDWTVRRVVGE